MVDTQADKFASDAYPEALRVALRYVSFKPRTVAEVRRRVGRDFDQPVVEQAAGISESATDIWMTRSTPPSGATAATGASRVALRLSAENCARRASPNPS